MRRNRGFGVGHQGFHPKARGALSPDAKQHGQLPWHMVKGWDAEHYFVPSFSIRRHIHQSEEARWSGVQKQLSAMLGRHYEVMPPSSMAIKSIEQKALIEKIRQSGTHPTPDEMRDVVFNIRDDLTEALSASPDRLEVGLGRLAVFGRNHNKLALTISGWKGWHSRYALLDQSGEMSAVGALLIENRIALGGIVSALPDTSIAVNEIASNPHLTLACTNDSIRDHELRKIERQVEDLDLSSVVVGDPVISFKASPSEETKPFAIRHAWDSLAAIY